MILTDLGCVGMDEVGRGTWFGDVFACACTLDSKKIPEKLLRSIKDSKKLSASARQTIFQNLISYQNKELYFEIGQASPQEIDEINILQATFLAMNRAFRKLEKRFKISSLLIDGPKIIPPQFNIQTPMTACIRGDTTYLNIATASIIAKVLRDKQMQDLAKIYPNYGLEKHKGYGTAFHVRALEKEGPTDLHRKSFKPVKLFIK